MKREKQSMSPVPQHTTMGKILRQHRIRMGLSQEALAATIEVSSRSIRRWEMNLAIPQELYRERLSQLFGVDLQSIISSTHQTTQPIFAAFPLWHLPCYRNPFFTGHRTMLKSLHICLSMQQKDPRLQICALNGLAGIGKTQLAVEYAYKHANHYQAIFWVAAENIELVVASFLQIAQILNLPDTNETHQDIVIEAVQHWLTTHSHWLLIWDNLEDLDLFQRFLLPTRQGSILITTRLQALGMLAHNLEVPPLAPEEGATLLLKRAKLVIAQDDGSQANTVHSSKVHDDFIAAKQLAEMMGGLPLALDQAGAYIEEIGCGIQDYIQCYQHQQIQFLNRRGATSKEHPASVLATFSLIRQRLEKRHKLATDLLKMCAFLHTDAIPEEIFDKAVSSLADRPDAPVPEGHLSLLDATLAALRNFSLIRRNIQAHMFSIHRIVQIVIQKEIHEEESIYWKKRTIGILNALFPESTQENWETCKRLLPHVSACATSIPEHIYDENLAEVLRKAADYFRIHAQFKQAEKLYQRARMNWQYLGKELYMEMNRTLCGLGLLFVEQAKYEVAESLFLQVLHNIEQIEDQPYHEMLGAFNGLALLYYNQGKYAQAQDIWQQALNIMARTLGSMHLQAARFLNNLAHLCTEQENFEEAEKFLQKAIQIRESALHPTHLQIASLLSNLSKFHYKKKNYLEAEKLCLQALAIRERALGTEHPIIAYSLNSLGDIYRCEGRYEKAEEYYLRCLWIREKLLEADHPFIKKTRLSLENLYAESGREK